MVTPFNRPRLRSAFMFSWNWLDIHDYASACGTCSSTSSLPLSICNLFASAESFLWNWVTYITVLLYHKSKWNCITYFWQNDTTLKSSPLISKSHVDIYVLDSAIFRQNPQTRAASPTCSLPSVEVTDLIARNTWSDIKVRHCLEKMNREYITT